MQQNSDHHRLKFIAGADAFGSALKDTLVSHLRSLNIEVEDIGTDSYYTVGEKIGRTVSSATTTTTTTTVRGLVACGTGVGVSIFANKFPGVYAATCLTPSDAINARSINNCNVIAFSGMSSSPESAIETLDNFLNTPFKSPCPASNNKPWPDNIQSFFDESLTKMSEIGSNVQISSNSCQISSNSSPISSNSGPISSNLSSISSNSCSICNLSGGREFSPVEIMPGGSMVIVRESPTSAVVRFAGGSVEPAHHHRHGHDVVVMKGRKIVWNLSKGERVELVAGDYLFTPAGDVHRVKYLEDTEFFIRWDGDWDIELDEDLATATANLEKEDANDAVVDLVGVLFPGDYEMQNTILSVELPIYKSKQGKFERPIALKGCEVNDDKFDPANWWETHGNSAPNLKKIAMRILSLTTSSSGCERN